MAPRILLSALILTAVAACTGTPAVDQAPGDPALDLQDLRSVVQQVASMQERPGDLENSYKRLRKQLRRWASEDAEAAAAALARYGD